MPTSSIPELSEDIADDLLYLARTGETTQLEAIIHDCAKQSSTTTLQILQAATDRDSGNNPLHMASANGHVDMVTKLLELAKEDPKLIIDAQNAAGNTPLHWASLNGHLDVVKALVTAGANVSLVNEKGYDACYYAEQNGKMEIAELLLKEGTGSDKSGDGPDRNGELDAEEDHVDGQELENAIKEK